MANILLLTQGTWGDIFPFVKIGKMLKARGHQVKLLGNRMFADRITQSGFDYSSLVQIELFHEWSKFNHLPDTKTNRLLHMKDQMRWIYEIIKDHCAQSKTLLVSHFGLHLAVRMAVDKLRVPCLSVYTSPYFMINTAIHEELYSDHSSTLNSMRANLDLPPVTDWHAWLRLADGYIGLWPDWFAAPEAGWPDGLETVGFVSNESVGSLPPDIEAFLRDSEPPILVNHGSSRPLKEKYFNVCIDACKQLGRPVLLVTQYEELIKDCVGEGILHSKFVHFPSIMPYTSAIIHHGGIGTSGQALAAGLPQFIFPDGSDGFDNGTRLKRMGVAEYLPPFRLKPELIAESLRHITTSPIVHERCRKFAERSRGVDAVAKACDVIEEFAAVHGHSEPLLKSRTIVQMKQAHTDMQVESQI